jgi:hypothetical protein
MSRAHLDSSAKPSSARPFAQAFVDDLSGCSRLRAGQRNAIDENAGVPVAGEASLLRVAVHRVAATRIETPSNVA